ncbi:MAG: hypothetical protein HFE77_04255 [Clostridiales bacterium]|nr:hypothetical protein [Clostridiales bacterium]
MQQIFSEIFSSQLRVTIKKCKIQLILFICFALVTILAACFSFSYAAFSLFAFAGMIISGIVCLISIFIINIAAYYNQVKKKADEGFEKPFSFFGQSIGAHLLLQLFVFLLLAGGVLLSPYYSDMANTSLSTEIDPRIEEIYGEDTAAELQKQTQVLSDFLEIVKEKGYINLLFGTTIIFNMICSYFRFVILLYAAISFCRIGKEHPVLATVFGFFALNLFGRILLTVVVNLAAAVAPGIQTALSQLNAFLSFGFRNYTELLDAAAALPEASLYSKIVLFSNLCSIIALVTNGVIACSLLKKKERPTPNVQ